MNDHPERTKLFILECFATAVSFELFTGLNILKIIICVFQLNLLKMVIKGIVGVTC